MIGKAVRRRAEKFRIPLTYGGGKDGKSFLVDRSKRHHAVERPRPASTQSQNYIPSSFLTRLFGSQGGTMRTQRARTPKDWRSHSSACFNTARRLSVFLHHAPKGNKEDSMTLENMFRGTGDIGTMISTA